MFPCAVHLWKVGSQVCLRLLPEKNRLPPFGFEVTPVNKTVFRGWKRKKKDKRECAKEERRTRKALTYSAEAEDLK